MCLLNIEGEIKSHVFSFSVKRDSVPSLQIIRQNGFTSPGLPEHIHAILVPLFARGSHVGPLRPAAQI